MLLATGWTIGFWIGGIVVVAVVALVVPILILVLAPEMSRNCSESFPNKFKTLSPDVSSTFPAHLGPGACLAFTGR